MKCPFDGRLCIRPKEIRITETTKDGEKKEFYVCKKCGEPYINQLPDKNKVSNTIEIIGSEEVINIAKNLIESEEELEQENTDTVSRMELEEQLKEAIEAEDYETAAKLRDKLNEDKK